MLKKNKPFILLSGFLLLAYLPMISFLMGIKNDALAVTYPLFYFFSDQLSQGHIPWWHYNLHLGFPLHADPGTPFWNPIFWLFALAGKNLFVFTSLIFFHVIIAAYGIVKLGKSLNFSSFVNLVLAVSYVCSGFYAAHLQHTNNLFEAAFLPYVLVYFLNIIRNPSLKNSLYLSVSLFFFVNSGYPGFPISITYFLVALFISCFLFDAQLRDKNINKTVGYLCLSFVTTVLLCLPYLISLAGIFDNFYRSNPYSLSNDFIYNGGITGLSLLSFLWPLSTALNPAFYKTDIAWNNLYTGIILACFFIYGLIKSKEKLKMPLLLAGLLLLLLSFQGNLKSFFFDKLPLLNLVRSNGGFRIYYMLSAIIISGFGLEEAFSKDNKKYLKIIFISGIIILSVSAIAAACMYYYQSTDHFTNNQLMVAPQSLSLLFQNISIPAAIVLQSIAGIVLLVIAIIYVNKKKIISLLIITDIILSFWINLPYTGLGTKSTASKNISITASIKKINAIPGTLSLKEISDQKNKTDFMGHPVLYSKNIGIIDETAYPSAFASYIQFLNSDSLKNFEKHRAVFLQKQPEKKYAITDFSINSNSIQCKVFTTQNDSLIVAQNDQSNWTCLVDNHPTKIYTANHTFIMLPITAGTHTIVLSYYPAKAVAAFWISLFVWLALLLALGYLRHVKRLKIKTT